MSTNPQSQAVPPEPPPWSLPEVYPGDPVIYARDAAQLDAWLQEEENRRLAACKAIEGEAYNGPEPRPIDPQLTSRVTAGTIVRVSGDTVDLAIFGNGYGSRVSCRHRSDPKLVTHPHLITDDENSGVFVLARTEIQRRRLLLAYEAVETSLADLTGRVTRLEHAAQPPSQPAPQKKKPQKTK